MLPSAITRASASGLHLFGAQLPTPPIPLFTLRRAPRDAQRKTRGQSGSLVLSRKNFAFSASCRFSPAHCNSDFATTDNQPQFPDHRLLTKYSCCFCCPAQLRQAVLRSLGIRGFLRRHPFARRA